jgi:hypothetical protein
MGIHMPWRCLIEKLGMSNFAHGQSVGMSNGRQFQQQAGIWSGMLTLPNNE